ncbi:MAG: hypothetical protein ACKVH0_05640, partial [Alphaproteobacteria bacterium]
MTKSRTATQVALIAIACLFVSPFHSFADEKVEPQWVYEEVDAFLSFFSFVSVEMEDGSDFSIVCAEKEIHVAYKVPAQLHSKITAAMMKPSAVDSSSKRNV